MPDQGDKPIYRLILSHHGNVRSVSLPGRFDFLTMLCRETKEQVRTADQYPGRRRFFNTSEDSLGIVRAVGRLSPEFPRGFRRFGRRHFDLPQHRKHATQRSNFAAMDNARIALKEPLNGGFIHLVRVESPIVQPLTEPGDRLHLHRRFGRATARVHTRVSTSQFDIRKRRRADACVCYRLNSSGPFLCLYGSTLASSEFVGVEESFDNRSYSEPGRGRDWLQ